MKWIEAYCSTISITVGVAIALIAWLIPDIDDKAKYTITALALGLPVVYLFVKWIFNVKRKLKEVEQDNKRLKISNAQWKRDLKHIEYKNQLLIEYKLFMETALRLASANSKELKISALLEANESLSKDMDIKMINYNNQEEVINGR